MAKSRRPRWIVLVLAMLLCWNSAALSLARTAEGTHCPTASVQALSVPVRDCCGKLIGFAQRKPLVGEATFMQCRCAEKQSAQQQANLDRNGLGIEMIPSSSLVLVLPDKLPEARAQCIPTLRLISEPIAPPVPPPA